MFWDAGPQHQGPRDIDKRAMGLEVERKMVARQEGEPAGETGMSDNRRPKEKEWKVEYNFRLKSSIYPVACSFAQHLTSVERTVKSEMKWQHARGGPPQCVWEVNSVFRVQLHLQNHYWPWTSHLAFSSQHQFTYRTHAALALGFLELWRPCEVCSMRNGSVWITGPRRRSGTSLAHNIQ